MNRTLAAMIVGISSFAQDLSIAVKSKPVYHVGESFKLEARITNNDTTPVSLVGCLERSETAFRLPKCIYTIFDPDGKNVHREYLEDRRAYDISSPLFCGTLDRLREYHIVILQPNESFDPFGSSFYRSQLLKHWKPRIPGRYTVVLEYDTRDDSLGWDGPIRQSDPKMRIPAQTQLMFDMKPIDKWGKGEVTVRNEPYVPSMDEKNPWVELAKRMDVLLEKVPKTKLKTSFYLIVE